MSEINITVSMNIKTCLCGGIFSIPNWVTSYDCPMCAERKIQQILKERDQAYQRQDHLQKIINGLRGALKRKKK